VAACADDRHDRTPCAEDSDTRIKPLALTNGHGRYMTVTPERTLFPLGDAR
jgi:hypothetical protein